MSSSWKEEYLSSLDERCQIEKGDQLLIDAYTRLADRLSSLEAAKEAGPEPSTEGPNPSTPIEPNAIDSTSIPHLRASLASALRTSTQNHHLHTTTLTTLSTLRTTTSSTILSLQTTISTLTSQISTLTSQVSLLQRKLRDKEEELKGKGRLVESVQDEMVSLGLELNMCEKKMGEVRRENEMLVERWMRRVGREADELNGRNELS